VTPEVPYAGLDEVLRAWGGRGQLWDALASVGEDTPNYSGDPRTERRWSARDVRRRAHRVFLQQRLLGPLSNWPTRPSEWIEALPAESVRRSQTTPYPTSGVSWANTRKSGWPPREFRGRTRSRIADSLLVTTLRWTLEVLREVWNDARAVEREIGSVVAPKVSVAFSLLDAEPMASAESVRPSASDIRSLRTEGRPWNSVASVAEALRTLDSAALIELASKLIMPDEELRWRLFHLGVFGELLAALRSIGCKATSIRPLSGGARGPSYHVSDDRERTWHLWFEGAGIWSRHDKRAPYVELTTGLIPQAQPLSPDIVLILPGEACLIVECKYYRDPVKLCRDGYLQAAAYAVELGTEVIEPGKIVSVVVGPEDVITRQSKAALFVETLAGQARILPPSKLRGLIQEVIEGRVRTG